MVSYYNPLGVYQKGGGGQCGHGGWYQPPMLEDGGTPWHAAHAAHAAAHGHVWQSAVEWMPPDRPQSAPVSPRAGSPAHRPAPPRSPYEWMKKPSYQSQPNPGKTRTKDKYRVVYTDHQRLELEKEFHYSRYITIRRKAELAANLGLSERQVKIWFQNRRAKERKQVKKREEVNHKEKLLENNSSLHPLHQHAASLHHHHSAMMHQGLSHPGLSHQGMSHQALSHQGMTHQSLHHQGLGAPQPLHSVPPVQLI